MNKFFAKNVNFMGKCIKICSLPGNECLPGWEHTYAPLRIHAFYQVVDVCNVVGVGTGQDAEDLISLESEIIFTVQGRIRILGPGILRDVKLAAEQRQPGGFFKIVLGFPFL